MLIKFEYKFELPQFWIEKTYLTWMIVDIVQHQNKLYHIKDPWEGNHKHTNSTADKTDQIISSVGNGNQMIIFHFKWYYIILHVLCGYFWCNRFTRWKTSHMRDDGMKWIGWSISVWYLSIAELGSVSDFIFSTYLNRSVANKILSLKGIKWIV